MNNLLLKGLRTIFLGIWYVLRTLVNYFSMIIELSLVYSSVLILMSFYFYGEVTFSMTAHEFFTSKLFTHIVMISSVMALLVTMLRILFRANSREEKILLTLDLERRFAVNESENFLRVMRKCGFPMIINPNLASHKNEIERAVWFFKAALYLRDVDCTQFTKDEYLAIGNFIKAKDCEKILKIREMGTNKLGIMDNAIPLVNVLMCHIESMSNEVFEMKMLNNAKIAIQNYLEDERSYIPLIIVADHDVIVSLKIENATILNTFASVDKVELFQKARAFDMKPFELCTEDEFKMLDQRIIDCCKVIKYEKETV